MQGVVGLLLTSWLQIYQGIFQRRTFENRLRFHGITGMSSWPHFFGPPCTTVTYTLALLTGRELAVDGSDGSTSNKVRTPRNLLPSHTALSAHVPSILQHTGADFHEAMVATAPGGKLLIGRRPVRNWTHRTISSVFCAENYIYS